MQASREDVAEQFSLQHCRHGSTTAHSVEGYPRTADKPGGRLGQEASAIAFRRAVV